MKPDVVAQLLPIALLLVLLYLLVIRPARKRAQQVSTLQSALSVGDEVMLSSGIYAQVVAVEDDKVRVSVADGVVVTVHRGAVAQMVNDVPAEDELRAEGTLEERSHPDAAQRPDDQEGAN
ncbi:MAG: preprotein translocase subunit YajC [Nocardioidaceae bacterium]